jgi:hypothetical protein
MEQTTRSPTSKMDLLQRREITESGDLVYVEQVSND